jgi:hypothetical protein
MRTAQIDLCMLVMIDLLVFLLLKPRLRTTCFAMKIYKKKIEQPHSSKCPLHVFFSLDQCVCVKVDKVRHHVGVHMLNPRSTSYVYV